MIEVGVITQYMKNENQHNEWRVYMFRCAVLFTIAIGLDDVFVE